MNGNSRDEYTEAVNSGTPPSAGWLFAQAIFGKPIPNPASAAAQARRQREELERLAAISPRHAAELRRQQTEKDEARHDRKLLEWLAQISPEHASKLRSIQTAEAEALETHAVWQEFYERSILQEGDYDPAKHPRGGNPQNRGQYSRTGGLGSAAETPLFLAAVLRRNAAVAELSGVMTPGMVRSGRLANELTSAARLPGEVARAAAAGFGTGGKALVNGTATAVRSALTLGFNANQLELIGVTKEDRARGYDTAVAISTASGQVFIAVGTGGLAAAVSKGGTVAKLASGALLVYDAAGNAAGVVQGTLDATQNGVTLSNGAQIAGGLLGLGANAIAVRDISRVLAARRLAEVDEFVATLPRSPTPTTSAANRYEIKHTGPHNYTVSGGGAKFDIDGYRGSTILEAKHVGDSKASHYVPGSSCPPAVRTKILKDVRDELRRSRTIIESGSTPFKDVEIITNSPGAKKYFEGLLKEMRVPGTVRLEP